MTDERRVQPCTECGWPALLGTRRCPYCRVRMSGARRFQLMGPRRAPLHLFGGLPRWLILAWFLAMAPAVLLTAAVFGLLPAAMLLLVTLTPPAFLWALNRRSAARIRGLNPPAGHRAHTPGSANRPTSGPRS